MNQPYYPKDSLAKRCAKKLIAQNDAEHSSSKTGSLLGGEVQITLYDSGGMGGMLDVKGEHLEEAYPDDDYCIQVEDLAKKFFPQIKQVRWSEQGMQGKGRWNFDVNFN